MGIKSVVIFAAGLSVGGCIITQSQQDAADDANCRSYGAAYGSQAYVSCRTQQAQSRQQMYGAAIAANAENNRRNQEALERTLVRPQINCQSATYGNVTDTTCR